MRLRPVKASEESLRFMSQCNDTSTPTKQGIKSGAAQGGPVCLQNQQSSMGNTLYMLLTQLYGVTFSYTRIGVPQTLQIAKVVITAMRPCAPRIRLHSTGFCCHTQPLHETQSSL